MRRVALLLVGLFVIGSVAGRSGASEEQTPRALQQAREAILDGRLEEAERILNESAEMIISIESALLRGLIALQRGDAVAARKLLEEVVESDASRGVAWIYLAQAHLMLEDHEGALAALDRASGVGEDVPEVTVLRARAHEGAGQPRLALATLEIAVERLANSPELHQELVFFYLRAGLSGAGIDAARRCRTLYPSEPRGWVLLGDALRRGRSLEEATEVLEEARLRFPDAEEITEQLAYTYALRDMPVAAARLFAELALESGTHAFEVADQLRVAGRHEEALRWNARVPDGERRLPQRLAILVGQERFAHAVVVGELARAEGVLDDGSLYPLGFATVLAGRTELAETLVERLRSSGRMSDAERLEALMDRCREEPWLCR